MKARVGKIKDGLDKMTNPTRPKLETYHYMIDTLRKEAPEEVLPPFKPLYDHAYNDTERTLQLDREREALLQPILDELIALETRIVGMTPDNTPAALPRSSSNSNSNPPNDHASSTYKMYQKK